MTTPPPPPVYITDVITNVKSEVPSDIVKYCESFTSLDAHAQNNGYNSLRLYDCYLYNMGLYGYKPEWQRNTSEPEGTDAFKRSMDDDGGNRTSHTFVF